MTIAAVKAQVIKPERIVTPQCCVSIDAPAHNPEWRKNYYSKKRPGFDHDRCQHESVVQIDGKFYCRPHAGQLALKRWLSGELVEKEATK